PPDLHSFPTRRSSDLRAAAVDDPWRGLTDFLTGTLQLMAANRGLHDVVTAAYTSEWMEQLEERVNPLLHQLLVRAKRAGEVRARSEEHTSELQSPDHL